MISQRVKRPDKQSNLKKSLRAEICKGVQGQIYQIKNRKKEILQNYQSCKVILSFTGENVSNNYCVWNSHTSSDIDIAQIGMLCVERQKRGKDSFTWRMSPPRWPFQGYFAVFCFRCSPKRIFRYSGFLSGTLMLTFMEFYRERIKQTQQLIRHVRGLARWCACVQTQHSRDWRGRKSSCRKPTSTSRPLKDTQISQRWCQVQASRVFGFRWSHENSLPLTPQCFW